MRYVLGLQLNLVSIEKLDEKGYNHIFVQSQWKLSKDFLVLARQKKYCILYRMESKLFKGKVNASEEDSSTELWYRQLSHMSEK